MKKLTFDSIIEKIWRQGFSKWYKSKKFWMCTSLASVLTATAVTTTTYFAVNKNEEKPILTLTQVETPEDIIYDMPKSVLKSNPETVFYNIDGKNFSTYEKAFDYFKLQLKKEENSYNLLRYSFEGQEYATQKKLYDVFKKRFAIKKIKTLKNPNKNIINSANQVSRNAITTPVENFRTIYRWKDGSAYTNYDDALKTYMDYDQKYYVENLPFENRSDALWHIQHTKQEQLDEQIKFQQAKDKDQKQKESSLEQNKTECFLQGGYCQTEEELRAWLEKNTKVGFEYKGKIFSDYNYEEFEKEFKVLDQDIIDKNIKQVDNADMNSFWVSHPANVPGFFVGPKYVETSTAENTLNQNSHNWEIVDSFTPAIFLAPLALTAFGTMTNVATETNEEYSLKEFVNKITTDIGAYSKLNVVIQNYANKPLKEFESNFPDTNGMSSFEKTLVILKRVLNYLYTTDTFDDEKGNSPDKILKTEFKSLIKKILQSDKMKTLYNESFIIKGKGIDIYDQLSFDSIYSIFLNPGKFMETNENKQEILKINKNIQNTIQKVMDAVDNIQSLTSTVKDAFDSKNKGNEESALSVESKKSTKYQRKTTEYHKNVIEELSKETTTVNSDGSITMVKEFVKKEKKFHLNTDNISVKTKERTKIKARGGFPSPSGILSAISKAWEISNMLSFVSIQTKKMQIDDNQALYYSEPTLRIPIIGTEFPIQTPEVVVTKLVESPLTRLIGSNTGKDGEKPKVWQLSSNYYTKFESAVKDLKMLIYKNPKKYLGARTLETNVMDKYLFYYIDSDEMTEQRKTISTAVDIDINEANNNKNKKVIEKKRIAEAREKFITEIINKHFKPNAKRFYLDGFGETFDDPASAKNSLLEKLQDASKTIIKNYYSYKLDNGEEIIAQTPEEMENKIHDNVVIPTKTVISSDLFSNSTFDSLQDNSSQSGYEVYQLEFYGEKLYFSTYNDAWNYLLNHSKYEQHIVNVRNVTYRWKNQLFNSTDQYYDQFTKNVRVRKNRQSEVKLND